MPRKLSRVQFLRELDARKAFSFAPKVENPGSAKWSGPDFDYHLSLEARGQGRATWILWVRDRMFREAHIRGLGAAKLTLRPLDDEVRAITNGERDLEILAADVRMATVFVRGRADLCRILMSEGSIIRIGVEAWQMPSNYPSRLAEALILSRSIAREDIETEVRSLILAAADTNMFGRAVPAEDSVRRWLKEYGRYTFEDLRHAVWAVWQLDTDAEVLAPEALRAALRVRSATLAARYSGEEGA